MMPRTFVAIEPCVTKHALSVLSGQSTTRQTLTARYATAAGHRIASWGYMRQNDPSGHIPSQRMVWQCFWRLSRERLDRRTLYQGGRERAMGYFNSGHTQHVQHPRRTQARGFIHRLDDCLMGCQILVRLGITYLAARIWLALTDGPIIVKLAIVMAGLLGLISAGLAALSFCPYQHRSTWCAGEWLMPTVYSSGRARYLSRLTSAGLTRQAEHTRQPVYTSTRLMRPGNNNDPGPQPHCGSRPLFM